MKHIFIVGIVVALMLILTGTNVLADSIFDVDHSGEIDVADCSIIWFSIRNGEQNMDFDVNADSLVDVADCSIVFSHLGEDVNGDGDTILDWLSKIIWGN